MADFVVLATADWDHPLWTNKQHTALTLAAMLTFLWRGMNPRYWWRKEQARRYARRGTAIFAGLLVVLAILIALAQSRPLLCIPMAILFAALRTGAGFLASTGVDRKIVDVVQALLVLALLIPPAVQFIRERRRALAAVEGGGD